MCTGAREGSGRQHAIRLVGFTTLLYSEAVLLFSGGNLAPLYARAATEVVPLQADEVRASASGNPRTTLDPKRSLEFASPLASPQPEQSPTASSDLMLPSYPAADLTSPLATAGGGPSGGLYSFGFASQAPDGTGLRLGRLSVGGDLSLGAYALTQKTEGNSVARRGNNLGSGLGNTPIRNQNDISSGVYGIATLSLAALLGNRSRGRFVDVQQVAVYSYPSGRNDSERDFDHTLSVSGTYLFTKLRAGFAVYFSELSGLSRDVGVEADRALTNFTFTTGYTLSEQTQVGWSVMFPERRVAQGISSAGFTTTGTFDYIHSPKTTLGLGVSTGLLEVDPQPNQHFEQVTLRLAFNLSEKLRLNGNVGVEHRTAGVAENTTPILQVGATWRIRPRTTLTLTANRSVLNSAAIQNANFVTTSVQLAALQEIGNGVNVSAALAYENAGYYSVGPGGSGARRDDLLIGQLGVSRRVTNRITLAVDGSAGRNWSNDSSLRFAQCTLQARFRF